MFAADKHSGGENATLFPSPFVTTSYRRRNNLVSFDVSFKRVRDLTVIKENSKEMKSRGRGQVSRCSCFSCNLTYF